MEAYKTKRVTESGVVKSMFGKLKKIVIASHTNGTLKLIDGLENGAAAVGTITQSVGAATPASHGQTKLTSSGAMVPATHAISVLTGSANFKDAVKASAVLTADQSAITDGSIVVIGAISYRFKTTPVSAYDVKIGSNAADSMYNLYCAINAIENGSGQQYKSASPHPTVDAVLTSTYVITVTAKTGGTAGNSIAKSEDDAHLDWDGAGAALTGGLAAETITIGTKVYTFKDTLSSNPLVANQVKIGSTLTISLANLLYAINADDTQGYAGVKYSTGTVAHTQVVAVSSNATTITIRGRLMGTSLNTVATTETCASASWADTTLGGGTGVSNPGVTVDDALVVMGAITYTIVDELSEAYGADAVAYQVKRGASEATMLDNLKSAINGTTGEGTVYGTGTVAHPYLIATTNTDTVQTVISRTVGTAAETTIINDLATTTSAANTAWEDTTFGGGTGDSNPVITLDDAQITIGDRTYTAVLELSETSGAEAVVDQILWVTNEDTFINNFKKTINASGIAGTDYSTGTTENVQVRATTNGATSQVVEARFVGVAGNSIATTATLTNYAWGAVTLASGTGATAKLMHNTITLGAAEREIDFGNEAFDTALYVEVGGVVDSEFVYE